MIATKLRSGCRKATVLGVVVFSLVIFLAAGAATATATSAPLESQTESVVIAPLPHNALPQLATARERGVDESSSVLAPPVSDCRDAACGSFAPQQGEVAGEIISIVVSPDPATAGSQVVFSVTVGNVGDMSWPAEAGVAIEIRNEGGALVGAPASTFGKLVHPGETLSVTADWPVPPDSSHDYAYVVSIFSGATLMETSEAGTLSVQPAPSVAMQAEEHASILSSSSGSLRVALVPNASGAFGGTGPLWTNVPEIPGISFTNLPLGSVNAGFLASYDTVVLVQICNIGTAMSSSQKMDLIDWVGNGGKLIIYDSDACSGSNTPDYSWFIYPFSTDNPGQQGAHGGVLTVMEENTLSSADPASPYYIDTADLVANTDAVGDSNVMVTRDPHWYVDMESTNVHNVTGYVHAYSEFGHGLTIYNGLDVDYVNNQWLRKIWVLELQQPWDPSGLPRAEPIVSQSSIQASPTSVPADGISAIKVTVTIRDADGNRLPGQQVRVKSSRGNIDVFESSDGITDYNGRFVTMVRSYKPGYPLLTAQLLATRQAVGSSVAIVFTPIDGGQMPPLPNDGPISIVDATAKWPLDGLYPALYSMSFLCPYPWCLENTIKVSVDWRGSTPGHVDFLVNGTRHRVAATSEGAEYTLNMGRDFRIGVNSLRVIACNAAGQASNPLDFAPRLWDADWLKSLVLCPFCDATVDWVEGTRPKLRIYFDIPPRDSALTATTDYLFPGATGLEGWQLFARLDIPIGDVSGGVTVRGGKRWFDADEMHRAAGRSGHQGLKVWNTELAVDYFVEGTGGFRQDGTPYVDSVSIGGESSLSFEKRWSLLVILSLTGAGAPVYATIDELHIDEFLKDYAYVYVKVTPSFEARGTFTLDPIAVQTFSGGIGVDAEGGARIDARVAYVKAYIGVNGDVVLCWPDLRVCEWHIGGGFGAEFKALWWKRAFEWRYEQSYEEPASSQLIAVVEESPWSVVPRSYSWPYAVFSASHGQQASVQGAATVAGETLLVTNVFTYAEPSLALRPADDHALLAWVHDDLSKPWGQGYDLRYSRWNGTAWSTPSGLTDDTYPDANPHLAWDGNGNGVAVWERLDDPALPVTATLDVTTTKKVEIAWSAYDPTSDTYSTPQWLTQNDALDAAPWLARNSLGQLMVVWRQNQSGLLGGDEANPDRILYSTWNSSTWASPAVAADNIPGVVDMTLGYGSGEAVLAYSQMLTPTGGITPTLQIFTAAWDGTTWSAPQQQTDDDRGNHSPQVVYKGGNQPLLVWIAGEDLTLLNLTTSQTATVELGLNKSVDDFRLMQRDDGILTAVWAGYDEDQRDVYVSVYDPVRNLWGRPAPITNDLANEAYLSPAFDGGGQLLMGYLKTAVVTQTNVISDGLGGFVTVTVPFEGQTDLYTLRHALSQDLSLTDADLTVSDQHPLAGAGVTFSATVHNTGDLALDGISVGFYDGDPDAGGELITVANFSGALAGGFTATVTATWVVPTSGMQHQIYTVVDPSNVISEADETNNQGVLGVFGPDLELVDAGVDYWSGSDVALVTLIRNLGTTAAPTSTVGFYHDGITGTLALSDVVPSLAAGESITLTTPWGYGSLAEGQYPLVATVNRDQVDFTEVFTTNNSADLTLGVLPDVAVSPLYFWADRLPDGRLIITGTVYNFGSVAATDVVAAVYANDPLTETNRLFTSTIASLPPASSALISGTWNAATSGYSLYLWADPSSAITETTRANNLASMSADFGVDIEPVPEEIIRGETTVYTLSLNSRNGFAAPVSLAVTGAPTGTTYILDTDAIAPPASVLLTITTDSTAPEGDHPLHIEAVGGGLTHTVAYTLTVVVPDYAPYVVPATQSVIQEEEASYTVAIAPYHGFSSPISLTVTGLPVGTSYIVAPNPITPGVQAVITVTLSPTAPVGTYQLTIVAASGTMTRTTAVGLTIVAAVRDLRVTKSLYSGLLFPGTDLQYRIYYYLSGNSAATDVLITDTLPVWLEYVTDSNSSGFTRLLSGATVVWAKARVLPGESGYLYLTGHIPDSVSPGTILTNTVRISNSRPETNYANNVYSDIRTVQAHTRDMSISKSKYSGTVVAGAEFTYRIQFANQGNSDASDVVVTDTLPLSTTYVSDQNSYGFTTVVDDNTVVWSKDSVAANSSGYIYLTVRVNDNVAGGTSLTNNVTVATSDAESDYTDNVYNYNLTAETPTVDMYLSKSLNAGNATPGNHLTYQIYYRNYGNSPALDVVVTDTLPVSTTYVSFSGAFTPILSGDQLIWNLGTVSGAGYSGYSGYLYATVHLAEEVPTGTVLTNTVRVATSSPETNYANNSGTDTRTVVAGAPDLRLYKYFENSAAPQGSEVIYRLNYYNNSYDAAVDVVLTDTLPISVTYVSSTGGPQPVVIGDEVVWHLPSIPGKYQPGYQGDIYLTAYISEDVPVGTVVTNTAVIAAPNDTNLANNADDDARAVTTASRDLYIDKTLYSGSPLPGNDLTYQIHYRNYGNAHLPGVIITDTLPTGATFVSTSGDFAPVVTGDTVVWQLGSVPGYYALGYEGNLYLTIHIPEDMPPGTVLRNRAEGSTSAAETGTRSNWDEYLSTVQAPTRDLRLYKSYYSGVPTAGSDITYRLRVYNDGNSPAASVRVTDTLPISATYASWSGDSRFTLAATADGKVVWIADELPGSSTSSYIYLTLHLDDDLGSDVELANRLEVSSSDVETDYSDNVTIHTMRSVAEGRDLKVTKYWSSGSPLPGQNLTYSMDYANLGTLSASNVVITDTLPLWTTFNSTYASGWSYTVSGQVVTYTRSSLSSQYSGYISLAVHISDTVPVGTILTNSAIIHSDDVDANLANNTTTTVIPVSSGSRDLYVEKTLSSGVAVPGGEITYRLYYRNYGTNPASNVTITDTLPAGVSYVSASGDFTPSVIGDEVIWQLGTIPGQYNSGYSGYLYLTVRIDESVPIGTWLNNSVEITTSDQETGFSSNVDTYGVTVAAATRDIQVDKYLYAGNFTAGNNVTYRLRVYNEGNVAAASVILTDVLPVGMTYLSNLSSYTPTVSADTIVWNLGTLNGNSNVSIDCLAHVSEGVQAGTALINSAEATTSSPEVDYGDNIDTDVHTVASGMPELRLYKYFQNSAAAQGSEVIYRLNYYNYSYDAAVDVVLTDTLPISVTYVSSTGGPEPVVSGNEVVWHLPSIAGKYQPGYQGDIYLTAYVSEDVPVGTMVTNTAIIATPNDTDVANNTDEDARGVVAATRDLYIDKTLYSGSPIQGNDLTYRIYYRNYGNAHLPGVIITDTLPSGTSFVSTSGDFTPVATGDTVVWEFGTVPGYYALGYEGNLYLTVHIPEETPPGTVLHNQAEGSTGGTETGTHSNWDECLSTVLAPTRDLYVSKSRYSGIPLAGNDITYRIYLSNQGNTPAADVIITDTMPISTTYVSHSNPSEFNVAVAGNEVVWVRDSMPSGSAYLYLTLHLDESIPGGTSLPNEVEASTSDPEVDYSDNRSTVTLTTSAPDLHEPDDTYAQASSITVNGEVQTHNFHIPGDQDWAEFEAFSGAAYEIRTANLGPGSDTYLYLYDSDGTTLLASNNNFEGLASRIEWTASKDGVYFIRVRHYSSSAFGMETCYDLELRSTVSQIIIGPSTGGELVSPTGDIVIDFPAGAVTETTTVTYTPVSSPTHDIGELLFAGRAFQLEGTSASGDVTSFTVAFTITISYEDRDWQEAGIAHEDTLNLYYWDGSSWIGMLPCWGCYLDIAENRLVVILDHFTEFVMAGSSANTIYIPFVVKNYTAAGAGTRDVSTPASTPTTTPTYTATSIPTPAATFTPTQTLTNTPSSTPTSTSSGTPTATGTPTPSSTPTITATVPITYTATATCTPSPTEEQEEQPEPTSTSTASPPEMAVPTPTEAPTPTTAQEEEAPA